jgi:hypothetical protein
LHFGDDTDLSFIQNIITNTIAALCVVVILLIDWYAGGAPATSFSINEGLLPFVETSLICFEWNI